MQAATSVAASAGGYPQQSFGAMPPLMHGPLGVAAGVQQLPLSGPFPLFQSQGPPQAPLHPVEMSPGRPPLAMSGLHPSGADQPFILQPPMVLQQDQHEEGHTRAWPSRALQGGPVPEQDGIGPSPGRSGALTASSISHVLFIILH